MRCTELIGETDQDLAFDESIAELVEDSHRVLIAQMHVLQDEDGGLVATLRQDDPGQRFGRSPRFLGWFEARTIDAFHEIPQPREHAPGLLEPEIVDCVEEAIAAQPDGDLAERLA